MATVALSTANGSKSLPVTVSDAQGRGASTTISLTVTAPVPQVAIHDVQGAGVFSPWADNVVQVEGVVTAVKGNGFFIQAPEFESDADVNTSEGIFVFTSSTPPAAAAVGNRVRVRGTVQDFIPSSDPLSPPVTEIAGFATVVVVSTGNPLPAPITLTPADLDPAATISQLSKYEGMRVHVDVLEVVAPTGGFINEAAATSTSNGIFFGVLPGTPRPFREPGIEAPAAAPAGVPQFDANPERLRIDSDGQVGTTALDVATGAQVSDLTGVLDFGSRTYTLDPDPGTTPTVTGNDAAAVPVRAGAGEGEITVASFNLERFYDTVNDPSTSDAILTAAALDRRLAKASLAIRDVLHTPDILGVEEMENLTTLQALATRIDEDAVAAGETPPGYQAYLEEGNDIGGIDVGLLVKASRIDAIGVEQLGKDATFVQPDGATALLNDRPPLVMKAELKPSGKELPFTVRIIVNHLRSLSGIDGTDGARIRAKRLAQAEFLADLINGYQLAGEKVVSVGDYNAFDINDGYVDVIKTVRGGPPVEPEPGRERVHLRAQRRGLPGIAARGRDAAGADLRPRRAGGVLRRAQRYRSSGRVRHRSLRRGDVRARQRARRGLQHVGRRRGREDGRDTGHQRRRRRRRGRHHRHLRGSGGQRRQRGRRRLGALPRRFRRRERPPDRGRRRQEHRRGLGAHLPGAGPGRERQPGARQRARPDPDRDGGDRHR